MTTLTVCYLTGRADCKFGWFADSLAREAAALPEHRLVVIDRHHGARPLPLPQGALHVPPKPNVWNGPHRLTRAEHFAAASARNTGLCLAGSEWVVYCDDLSVLLPGWGAALAQNMRRPQVVCGAYKKVKCLRVEAGGVAGYVEHPAGNDARLGWSAGQAPPVPAGGNWLYGCSVAMPVEALLAVNGWDENCDGTGGEDYCTGIRLQNAGWGFVYDPRMMTYESEEHHHAEPPLRRFDKGTSPNDRSHALLRMAQRGAWAPNYFGEGGVRLLRERVLAGEPFPVVGIPEHDFFDSQPLRDM